jgi:hypothetical protein
VRQIEQFQAGQLPQLSSHLRQPCKHTHRISQVQS